MAARIHEIDDGSSITSCFVDPRSEQRHGFGIVEFETASFALFSDFTRDMNEKSFLFVRRQVHRLRLGREYYGSVSVRIIQRPVTRSVLHQINILTATATPKVITIARMTLGFILPASMPPK